ncbi:glutamate-rich protein 6 isoform X2 [Sceloporus undulatus]|uniref:glutamate-rich protein 6 isoform X2 n=1 Tax=Sceloporus undulatus TaxID=8520 RepID=UPI001C4A83D3|nr:glutamate-rich protein 6 isoform X2 [Sceloporus undulatus]
MDPQKEASDGGPDSDNEDIEKGHSPPPTNNPSRTLESSMTNLQHDSSTEMEAEETTEEPAMAAGPKEDLPEGVKSQASTSSVRSNKDSQEEKTDGYPEPGSDVISSVGITELSSLQTTETSSLSTGFKGLPRILGGVRRESTAISELSREALDTIADDMHQEPLERAVSVQTEASWLYEHVFKKSISKDRRKIPRQKDIYAVMSQDLSSLDVLCDTEFKDDFLKLFKESLRTLSSVGPPTILAYRPESSREGVFIEVEKSHPENCEFCGSPLRNYPSFESLEQIAAYGYLFCCQKCRELHEFIVNEKQQYIKSGFQCIDITGNQAQGSESERQLARERARQRLKERQLAKQLAYLAKEQEREITHPVHTLERVDNKQLRTISYTMSQESLWTRIPLQLSEKRGNQDVSYNISYCDITIAGLKLVKNQFLQQYYKNGVKFLTMFPDGTAQIFYPSGNLAIIVVQKNENAGYICIVQEDKPENPEIQGVFDSCGSGTCYHPNGIVWINITIQGGHYSDQAGNKVKMWIWPNNLQKSSPRVPFKPVFLSLNLNVGVRILAQDKIAISFLAMGKQAKINIGTKIKLFPDHHPWPKDISDDDLLLFASRIKILRIFAKIHGCLDFPTSDWGAKVQFPSYLSKRALRLIHLCKECEINSAMDNLITEILNSPT